MKILSLFLVVFVFLIAASGFYLASNEARISQTETLVEIPQERYLP
ncbi:MAG: hypothetical protein L6Q57_04690 [Alphaproteobacteria bacterium]|nr:hypothetical protein [Alphaproteobacteria bacterium]